MHWCVGHAAPLASGSHPLLPQPRLVQRSLLLCCLLPLFLGALLVEGELGLSLALLALPRHVRPVRHHAVSGPRDALDRHKQRALVWFPPAHLPLVVCQARLVQVRALGFSLPEPVRLVLVQLEAKLLSEPQVASILVLVRPEEPPRDVLPPLVFGQCLEICLGVVTRVDKVHDFEHENVLWFHKVCQPRVEADTLLPSTAE
mmetsp:Transcript_27912/g.57153  ORF Transcript_27912/g.57153 Transcript_27912/m.57153 type:complete len:202 (+) Transcript_27912:1561-2166(+)